MLTIPRRGLLTGASALAAYATLPINAEGLDQGGSYPPSVTRLGLQPIHDLWGSTGVGPSGPLPHTPASPQGGSLPPGWSIGGGNILICNGDASVANYDFSGYIVQLNSPNSSTLRTISFVNCRFSNPPSGRQSVVNYNPVGYIYKVTFTNCYFGSSATAGSGFDDALVFCTGFVTGSAFTNCQFETSSVGFIDTSGDVTISNCTFGCPGLGTDNVDQHYNYIRHNGDYTANGGMIITNSISDVTPPADVSSIVIGPENIFSQANASSAGGANTCTITVSNFIQRGLAAFAAICDGGASGFTGGPASTGQGPGGQKVSISVSNSAISKDFNGLNYEQGAGTTISHSDNRDYGTNALV